VIKGSNVGIRFRIKVKIAVNTQHLLKDKLEGIGWFAHETLSRIVNAHREHEFLFIFDRPWDNSFIYAPNVIPVSTKIPSRHPFLWYWHYEIDVPGILKKYKPDLFFSPDGWISLSTKIPTVDTIHDINFIHRPDDLPFLVRNYYNYFFPKFANFSKRIITVSEYSKADLVKTFKLDPSKIDVAYNGCNQRFRSIAPEVKKSVQKRFTEGLPYFIYVGSLNPRKNILGLLEAFELFRKSSKNPYKLVFAGEPMWSQSPIKMKLEEMQFKEDVVFTDRISSEILQLVLSSSEALVMPSFYEGFGIPVVEALYCDIPVICSNVTSLPEVAGKAALYIDPFDVNSIKKALFEISTNLILRDQLIREGQEQRQKFNWDNTANSVWLSIQKALGE
jgi:glycosyltransferase involved in cell wall biosynthesis